MGEVFRILVGEPETKRHIKNKGLGEKIILKWNIK
jgi:hypothetical protein